MKKNNILSIGEAFIDLVSSEPTSDLSAAKHFMKHAGGAPANVAVGIARLDVRSAFLGKVGDDSFGRFVIKELMKNGVNTGRMILDPQHKTRLAFVAVMKNGNRDFEFWEKDPADEHLKKREIPRSAIEGSSIINIGPFMLLNPETRRSAFAVAALVKKIGNALCFDPNIRISLWSDKRLALRLYRKMIRSTTILRLNDAEAEFLTGTRDLKEGMKQLLSLGPELVVVTRDKAGCSFMTKKFSGDVKGFRVKAVDTTGCGDGFLAGLLSGIIKNGKPVKEITLTEMKELCRTANAVGALAATKRGAIAAMPSGKTVTQFLRRHI